MLRRIQFLLSQIHYTNHSELFMYNSSNLKQRRYRLKLKESQIELISDIPKPSAFHFSFSSSRRDRSFPDSAATSVTKDRCFRITNGSRCVSFAADRDFRSRVAPRYNIDSSPSLQTFESLVFSSPQRNSYLSSRSSIVPRSRTVL